MKREITVKIDSKGRMRLPPGGENNWGSILPEENQKRLLIISSKQEDALEEFRKLITSPHRKQVGPHLPVPKK